MKQRWFSTDRIGAISDGVFAIAMTLLVLEVKLPELHRPVSSQEFLIAIVGQGPTFIAWLISFAILCRLWMTQHGLLVHEGKKSRGFATLNFVFLGAIAFIPFPTSLISEHPEQGLSVIIFSATYVVAGLALAGMWLVLEKEGTVSVARSEEIRGARRIIIGIPVIACIACLLTLVAPRLGIFVWIVLPFAGIIVRRKKVKSDVRRK